MADVSEILIQQGITIERLGALLALAALIALIIVVRITRRASWQRGTRVPDPTTRVILFPKSSHALVSEADPIGVSASALSSARPAATSDNAPLVNQSAPLAREQRSLPQAGHSALAASLSQALPAAMTASPEMEFPASPAITRRRPKPASEFLDTVLSPETLLARAHELLAAGANVEAASQLRLCIRLASKLQQPLIEAAARLELGDLARASGDLTTACEHWLIARTLFGEHARAAEALAVETRMKTAGCPTDWVLTQF